jgi:methionyl-tRNA formyltransferase
MKLIFWGTPAIGLPTIEALRRHGHDIAAVVAQPDKEQGRHRQLVPPATKELAQKLGIPVLQPVTPNSDEFAASLRQLSPEVMVVVAYGKIFSRKILQLALYGYLNVHFSLLPKYRGASPVAAALLAGDSESGVTIIKLVSKMDAGPVLAAKAIPVAPDDTTASLQHKLAPLGAELLCRVLAELPRGHIEEIEQDESKATFCRTLQKEEGLVDWHKSAVYLERFVRAMQPWPTAYTFLHRQNSPKAAERIILHRAEVIQETTTHTPGSVVRTAGDWIEAAAGEGILRILMLQKAGKGVMKSSEFLRGTPLMPGDSFVNSE